MKSGLLWHDNSKKSMNEKISIAARRYAEKFGTPPTIAFINSHDFKDIDVAGIDVKTKETILPNHIWLGQSA